MDLKEAVHDLVKRSSNARDAAQTEEATKNAVIMPALRVLGFDVFDLDQVVPEYVADVGVTRGEKVDYALKIDGEIVALVEAKAIHVELGKVQHGQLYRYFSVTPARIAVLSNGRQFWFFTDIDEKNKMDRRPFFKFDLENHDEADIKELAKFHRDAFDIDTIVEAASNLKYVSAAADYLKSQMASPDDDMVKLIGRQIYDGMLTRSVVDDLRGPIRNAFEEIVRDRIQDRLNAAFSTSAAPQVAEAAEAPAPAPSPDIETTEEEWQAFYIVQAIGAEVIDPRRITIRDAQSYCSVFVDDNNRRPVCRFRFNAKSVKHLGLFDEEKNEIRVEISLPTDIYAHRAQLLAAIRRYL